MKIKLIGLIATMLCSISCDTGPSVSMLIGEYHSSRRNYNDSIFIKSDHSYKHKYTTADKRIFESVGLWEYDSVASEVLFKDFIFFNEAGIREIPPGNWFSKVKGHKNEVRLIYSSENNIYYSK